MHCKSCAEAGYLPPFDCLWKTCSYVVPSHIPVLSCAGVRPGRPARAVLEWGACRFAAGLLASPVYSEKYV